MPSPIPFRRDSGGQQIKTNMKKIITLLLLALSLTTQAQERVFQTVYKMATKTANDPQETPTGRAIARFRLDALTYLNTQTLYLLTDSAHAADGERAAHLSAQLDSMAYFMYDYVDLFQKEYRRAQSDKAKAKVIATFRSVSLQCPLFNDPDKELVWAYSNCEDVLTRFSLDTDWVKASALVRKKLRN